MSASRLTVYAYQDLIDQGWRRSGRYLYKPDLATSCCKAYTIRLDVKQFIPDKGQRRLLRKWRSFLEGMLRASGYRTRASRGPRAAPASCPPTRAVRPSNRCPANSFSALTCGSAGGSDAGAGAPSMGISSSELPTLPTDPGGAETSGASPPGAGTPAGHVLGRQSSAAERSHHAAPSAHAAAAAAGAAAAAAPADVDATMADATTATATEAEEERALQQLLSAALNAAVAAGDLPAAEPAAPFAPPAVRRCSEKQRACLPADVRYTSAAAFPLAVAIARRRAAAAAAATAAAGVAAGVAVGAGAGGARAPHKHADGAGAPAARKAGGSGPQQQRKSVPPVEGALSAHDVAQILARHFNALASAAWDADGAAAASGIAAEGREGAPVQAATAGQAVAAACGCVQADVAAGWRRHLPGRPDAYAASGHVNVRVPPPPAPQCSSTTAAAVGLAGGPAAPAAARGCGGSKPCTSGGGGGGGAAATAGADTAAAESPAGGATGGGQPSSRCSRPGDKPGAGSSAAAPARSPSGAAGTTAGRSGSGAGPGPSSLAMPCGRLEIRMVPSQFLQEEFELYKRYQIAQHGDQPGELSRAAYTRFLVDSPLPRVGRERDPEAPECGYGSFHQQYWLDGKLIAVGVVDVLPRCLSSVYLFWDTDLAPLALGRFTALQEIRWVQRQVPSSPRLHYYYMGFYIHTCPKMRYKAEYRPSDLLCPVRKVWVRITPQLLSAISQRPYLELSAQDGALCQPNLAARQPGSAPLPPASASASGSGSGSGSIPASAAAASAAAAGEGSGGDGGLDATLVVLSQQGTEARPMPFRLLRRLYVIPETVEQAISTWRAAVGWAAPSLVYRL